MVSITKFCPKCKEEKKLDEFYNSKSSKNGKRGWCKKCEKADFKRWRLENKEYALKKQREWRRNNREKLRAYNNKSYLKNKNNTTNKERVTKNNLKQVNELTDAYVKSKIYRGTNLRGKDIPLEMIEAYKELIKLKRELRK